MLRWYRKLVATKYDGSARRGTGRRPTNATVAELVRQMVIENPGWGYTRIRGTLWNLGHELGRNTIKRIEVVTRAGLVRSLVLFVMDLKTWRVEVGGIAHDVFGAWVEQVRA